MPDINQADYAIGHYHFNYLDRFFKYSIVFWQKINNIDIKVSNYSFPISFLKTYFFLIEIISFQRIRQSIKKNI